MNIVEDKRYEQNYVNFDSKCVSFEDMFAKTIKSLKDGFIRGLVDTSNYLLSDVEISIGHIRENIGTDFNSNPKYDFKPYIHLQGIVEGTTTEVFLVANGNGLSIYSRMYGEERDMDKYKISRNIDPKALALVERAGVYFKNSNFTPRYENSKDNEIKKVSFKDGEAELDVVYELYELINRIPIRSLTRLAIYERTCRFLEYGQEAIDIRGRCWSDVFLRQEFDKENKDFNTIISKKLKDVDNQLYQRHQYDNCSGSVEIKKIGETVTERIKQLGKSFDLNYFEIVSPYNIYRIFDTYARITNMKFDGTKFNVKYIYVPDYFEMVFFKTNEIPLNFFNKFEYKDIKMKNSSIIEIDGEHYGIMFIATKNEKIEYGLIRPNNW